jgi:hypothetical protein
LKHEDVDVADVAKKAIQKILKDNPLRWREILLKHKIIGEKRVKELAHKLNFDFDFLDYRYREKKLEGENAEDLNETVREFLFRKTVLNGLRRITEFGVDEGVLSFEQQENLYGIFTSLESEQWELLQKYCDAIYLFDYTVKNDLLIKAAETRSYKGLYPLPEEVKKRIKRWFSSRGFMTNDITRDYHYSAYYLLARDENYRSCIVNFFKTQNKRKYGDVELKLIGKGWSENEITSFQDSFWSQFSQFDNLI